MKYSFEEIERMRGLLWELTVQYGVIYNGNQLDEAVERSLRTHMQNGTTLEELDEAVTKRRAQLSRTAHGRV